MRSNRLALFSNRITFLGLVIVALAIVLSFVSPYFFSIQTLLDMTQFGALIGLLGMGQTLVILGGRGGIDLSVGAMVSLAGVLMALLMRAGVNMWLGCAASVAIGIGLGLANGFLVTRLQLPPLIATLGTAYIYNSVALVITNGVPVSGLPEGFSFLGQGQILGVPAQVLVVVVPSFLILRWVIDNTTFGRTVYMVGVNDTAARLAGVNVRRVRTLLYAISGMLAGLGAIVATSWLMGAKPDIGVGYDLQSITVAVLGGTSMVGGEGRLAGTMMAVAVVTMISYGLQLGNVNSVWQLAVLGLLLLGSIMANNLLGSSKT